MKRLIIAMLCFAPLMAMAQWETPDGQLGEQKSEKQKQPKSNANQTTTPAKPAKEYQWAAYLGDVVPTNAEGEVVWERTFNNNLSAEDNYNRMMDYLKQLMTTENMNPESRIALVNKGEMSIACHVDEYITFSSSFISLDRTRLIYTLLVSCADHAVTVKAYRISYWYDEFRKGGVRYQAETWITDKYAVNKKHTKLLPISGKFRRKTVDRMEQLMKDFDYEVKR